jgi:16S rRNA (cytidine1402-2'-O)-methyltransferase
MDHTNPIEKSQPRQGELFLVATPIGNLKDITVRAIEVLGAVDRIACEDTRTSYVLLNHYGIKAPLTAYHTHNEAAATETLLAELQQGARIALISDAGTPLLSDPGARLVRAAIAAGIRVTPIPGASALLAGLTITGLPAEQFYYAGFLPIKTRARQAMIDAVKPLSATLVFYEAPHRLTATLDYLAIQFGERNAAVARELTKLHEECQRGSLHDLHTHYEQHPPRGECVIVVAGAEPIGAMEDDAIDAALTDAFKTLRLKDAVTQVAKDSGRAKSDVYARALALKDADA